MSGFPEDRTAVGEGTEDLRAGGGGIETPDSGVRRRSPASAIREILNLLY